MNPDLFPGTKPPRAVPRVMMHFTDVGHGAADELLATFACARCGHESEWLVCDNATEVKRGIPCPVCNAKPAVRVGFIGHVGRDKSTLTAALATLGNKLRGNR